MKRFGFLLTDGDTEIMCRSWGETREEARESLVKSLNPFHSIVEDEKSIREFIKEAERDLWLLRPLNLTKSRAYSVFVEDLAALKISLTEKEGVGC